jgi:hypothetical protein
MNAFLSSGYAAFAVKQPRLRHTTNPSTSIIARWNPCPASATLVYSDFAEKIMRFDIELFTYNFSDHIIRILFIFLLEFVPSYAPAPADAPTDV